ncbi:hypothetical protein CAPTEDRAFT_208941 [Capitella teleta]|uniref:CCHC-type domain-containing protein n=1 Tax=Capitella teleta TaxID=283909 RepID=R7V8L9_CAPTE|nr:hypothetical protein CAPTEDRAFT_208941 [Capitella teleta]|eukprot:ELU12681.1 hypothetical protein CAPTEDRAFT_208941 [Capitella teleta]
MQKETTGNKRQDAIDVTARITSQLRDSNCPAKEQSCRKCNLKGHYARCCKTKTKQRREKADAYNITREDGFAFYVNGKGGKIDLNVGGVKLSAIIDSFNVIDEENWQKLKDSQINCKSQLTSRKLFAYGQKENIPLKGSFTTQVECTATKKQPKAEFTASADIIFILL